MTEDERDLFMLITSETVGMMRATYIENVNTYLQLPQSKPHLLPLNEALLDRMANMLMLQARIKEPSMVTDVELIKAYFKKEIMTGIQKEVEDSVGFMSPDPEVVEELKEYFSEFAKDPSSAREED